MSVTISINNNSEYVRANCPELITTHPYDESDPSDTYEVIPFEMNLASGNFGDLWRSLGLYKYDNHGYGELPAEAILKALKGFKTSKLVKAEDLDESGNVAIFIQGRSLEQATSYYWRLHQICAEAARRGELVVWS